MVNTYYGLISGKIHNRFGEKTPFQHQQVHERYPAIQRIDINNSNRFDIKIGYNLTLSNLFFKFTERVYSYYRRSIFDAEASALAKAASVRKFSQIGQNVISIDPYQTPLEI
jgi:hypothetical protein